MKQPLTDLELAAELDPSIEREYSNAIEFLSIAPDYSLLNFRRILESICRNIATPNQVDIDSLTLSDSINELFACQIVTYDIKSSMHELRKLCNAAIHRRDENSSEVLPDEKIGGHQETLDTRKSIDQKHASTARKLLVEIMIQACRILGLMDRAPKIDFIATDDQQHKETLYAATISTDSSLKFKAGLICESLSKQSFDPLILISSYQSIFQDQTLLKLSAAYYESSIKLSAGLDNDIATVSEIGEANYIFQFCDLEALYRYGLVATESILADELSQSGIKALRIAAERGHPAASAQYAINRYDHGDYSVAKKYAEIAASHDIALGHLALFYYYSAGKAVPPQSEKALLHLNQAADSGFADAIAVLGKLHAEGILVDQNRERAEQLLLDAIDKGSTWASRYYQIEYNDLAGKLATQMTTGFKALAEALDELKPKPAVAQKLRRNDPCPCGSGIKSKKCPCLLFKC